MALTAEQDKKFREEIEAIKNSKEKEHMAIGSKPDIVLEAKITGEGQLAWKIPNDLRVASYLLKVLDVHITSSIGARIQESLVKKDSIKSKLMRVFR